MKKHVPIERITDVNEAPVRPDGEYVLYWMVMARRTSYNWGLQRAAERCRELGKPLVVLEALRVGYPWASARFHRWALDGMDDNARHFAGSPVYHYPYVEPAPGAGSGLLETLAERACVVVTDEFPDFFIPRMVAAAGRKLKTRLEQVDGNGLLPLRAADRAYTHAHFFRRHLQRTLPDLLGDAPLANPLAGPALPPLNALPASITRRWPPASQALLQGDAELLGKLPIDHEVPPVAYRGGAEKAQAVLSGFVEERYPRYAERKNQPENPVNSGFSPYLHWGFLSAHQIFERIADAEDWTRDRLAPKPTGKREGWWGMSANGESFLDELITWREVSYNTSFHLPDHDEYHSLPEWALATLERHRADPRPELLSLDQMENGQSYDALWNATQGQLRREGRIHNYMRIVWGKLFMLWSPTPEEALTRMIQINNRWALDGRNPNSYSGIFWTMGRYDRAWGPERPVIGKVRPSSSTATARKVRVRDYIREYAPAGSPGVEDRGASVGAPAAQSVLPPD